MFVQISDVKSLLDFGTKKSGDQTILADGTLHHQEVLAVSLTIGLDLHEVPESQNDICSPHH